MADPRVDVTIGANVQPFNAGINAAMGSLRGFLTLGAFAAIAKGAIEFASALNDMAAKANVSVEWLQKVGFAAQQTGSSIEAVSNAVFELRRSQAQALAGSRADLSAFETLGITVRDLRSMKAEDLFDAVAAALKRSAGAASDVNAAMVVMGRAGRDLVPGMVDGFDDLAAKAEQLGLVALPETIARLDELGDYLDIVGLGFKRWTAELGANMAALHNWVGLARIAMLIQGSGARVAAAGILGGGGLGGMLGMIREIASLGVGINQVVDDYSAREAEISDVLSRRPSRSAGGVERSSAGRGAERSAADALKRIGLFVGGGGGPGSNDRLIGIQSSALETLRAIRRELAAQSARRARGQFDF